MQQLIRIHAIKFRADALRLTMADLCAKAAPAVSQTTVSRWLGGAGGANVATYESNCERLEAALIGLERVELARLAALHPDMVTVNAPSAGGAYALAAAAGAALQAGDPHP